MKRPRQFLAALQRFKRAVQEMLTKGKGQIAWKQHGSSAQRSVRSVVLGKDKPRRLKAANERRADPKPRGPVPRRRPPATTDGP